MASDTNGCWAHGRRWWWWWSVCVFAFISCVCRMCCCYCELPVTILRVWTCTVRRRDDWSLRPRRRQRGITVPRGLQCGARTPVTRLSSGRRCSLWPMTRTWSTRCHALQPQRRHQRALYRQRSSADPPRPRSVRTIHSITLSVCRGKSQEAIALLPLKFLPVEIFFREIFFQKYRIGEITGIKFACIHNLLWRKFAAVFVEKWQVPAAPAYLTHDATGGLGYYVQAVFSNYFYYYTVSYKL